MADYGDSYVVDETYRNSTDAKKDEFQGWLNGPVDRGIGQGGGIRTIRNSSNGNVEFIILISTIKHSKAPKPWEDVINLEDGIAHYWGDAKAADRPNPDNARGNRLVRREYGETYAQDRRTEAAPILLFTKPELGYVTFKGVCTIESVDIRRHKDKSDNTVVNYRFDLAILDTDQVDLQWIHEKSRLGASDQAPEAWSRWVKDGVTERYHVDRYNIRSTEAQIPSGPGKDLLQEVRSTLSEGTNDKGERFEYLVKFILENIEGVKNPKLTPSTGDKGVDITGEIGLLSDVQLAGADTDIKFKAQVKNWQDPVRGKHLSRLASRIDDGEVGLFFTTSRYTEDAQKENESTYPIRLFSGRDITDLLVQTGLAVNGSLNDSVTERISQKMSSSEP